MAYTQLLLHIRARLRIRSLLARQCLAEFLGVFVLLLLTQGSVAQAVTSEEAKGDFFTMFLAGSLAVTIAIYVAGNVSGAHLNPAFTLAMCLLGRFPWAKLPIYSLVQLVSAFCASGATYVLYYDALQNYTGGNLTVTGPKETASIFATYPAPYLSLNNGFLDQVLGTAMLIVGILAILDRRNKGVPEGLEPVAVGLLILAIGLSMGVNCGFPLNPARDLGPRLFTYVAGWGPEVFSAGNGWWWVPVVAPLVGATLGTAIYQLFVALHHPEDPEPAHDVFSTSKKTKNKQQLRYWETSLEHPSQGHLRSASLGPRQAPPTQGRGEDRRSPAAGLGSSNAWTPGGQGGETEAQTGAQSIRGCAIGVEVKGHCSEERCQGRKTQAGRCSGPRAPPPEDAPWPGRPRPLGPRPPQLKTIF